MWEGGGAGITGQYFGELLIILLCSEQFGSCV